MTRTAEYDVAVIGLGPVGAVLTCLLIRFGLKVAVFEQAEDVFDLPRAVHFDDEIMRVFQTIGIADEVAAISRINAGMRFVDPDGRLLLDWPRPQEPGQQGWHPSWRFHQPDLEHLLRRRIGGDASLHLGWQVTGLRDTGATVQVAAERAGKHLGCSARYVVGCDGGRSFMRSLIGGGTEDLGFHERWLVVDVLLRRDRPDLGDFTIQHCHPTNAATYVRGPGQRRRWEIALGNLALDNADDPDTVWPLLSRWIEPADAELERAAIYTFHSMIAHRWRTGRLLIAGDAAHQMPPFMGQGLCAGIRDAANLAWKLDRVLAGADSALLDSYQTERAAHVRAYIDGAIRLGGLINASDPDAALRGAYQNADGSRKMTSLAPRLGPGLGDDSPLAGRPAPQPRLRDGRLLDDAAGLAPALIATDEVLDGVRLPAGVAVFRQTDIADERVLDALNTRALLIRPDRYVLGAADDAAGLGALLASLPGTRT